MPKRIRDLDIENSAAQDSRLLLVKDNPNAEEVTISVQDFLSTIASASPSTLGNANFCFNPEFRLQQIRGEGDPGNMGPIIDTNSALSESNWFCDGWSIREYGFAAAAENLVVSHAVLEDPTDARQHSLQLTVDTLSGVPTGDNLLKLAFLLDKDARKELQQTAFTFSFAATFPRVGNYTVYVKDAFTCFVTSFTIAVANAEQTVEIDVPANTFSRVPAQSTFINGKFDSLEIGVLLVATKGGVDTEPISEVGADSYATLTSSQVIDYFIRSGQVSTIAQNDVFKISEVQISKAKTEYTGYDYLRSLEIAQRYFQKTNLQKIPAGNVFFVLENGDAGVPRGNNIGTISENLHGAQTLNAKPGFSVNETLDIRFKKPLKTHDNSVIKYALNPILVSDESLWNPTTHKDKSMSGVFSRLATIGGTLNRITTAPFTSDSEVFGPQLPPQGETFDPSSHIAPYPSIPGPRIPGWIISRNMTVYTAMNDMLPYFIVNTDSFLEELPFKHGFAHSTTEGFVALFQWYASSLIGYPGSNIMAHPALPA